MCIGMMDKITLKGDKNMENKKLYRSKTNKKLAGVCGGLGEYLNVDPTIVRLVWVLASLCIGSGILAYIIALIVMPEQPEQF